MKLCARYVVLHCDIFNAMKVWLAFLFVSFVALAGPSLQVIRPKNCSTICRRFSTFTLECRFYSPALLVTWFVPGQNNIQLSGIAGHTVQNKNGSVTVNVDFAMKFPSYACNVIFLNGQAMASERIEEEGTA